MGKSRVIRVRWGVLLMGLVVCAGLLGTVLLQRVPAQMVMNRTEETIRLPIIMYHHFSEKQSKIGDYTLAPSQLESDLKELQKRGYTPITTEQLCAYYEGEYELPQKPILLTFDDGYYSVYYYAYPLLKQYNVPATCFILGYYSQMYSDGEKQNLSYAHMTWEQLREMTDSKLISIGSHTYDLHHPRGEGSRYGISINAGESEQAYCDAVVDDLRTLSAALQENLGVTPQTFAYPFGAICAESIPVLRQMGFRIAFTCEEKVNKLHRGEEAEYPVRLGRYNRAAKYSSAEFFDRLDP